jgi:hypothetical protein
MLSKKRKYFKRYVPVIGFPVCIIFLICVAYGAYYFYWFFDIKKVIKSVYKYLDKSKVIKIAQRQENIHLSREDGLLDELYGGGKYSTRIEGFNIPEGVWINYASRKSTITLRCNGVYYLFLHKLPNQCYGIVFRVNKDYKLIEVQENQTSLQYSYIDEDVYSWFLNLE